MTRLTFALLLIALPFGACTCENENINERRPPTLTTDSDTIDFGDVPLGIKATRELAIRNEGEVDLTITQLRETGSDAFSVEDAPSVIAGGESGILRVSFRPSMAGPAMGELVLINNSERAERHIALRGNGVDDVICGPCDEPPAPECISSTELVTYDPVGVCDDGQCRYQARRVPCAAACTAGACEVPDGGALVPDAGESPDAGTPTTTPDGGINTNCMQLGTDVRVTNDALQSAWPDLAWNGTGMGLAWLSPGTSTGDGSDIGFAVVDGTGTVSVMPVMVTPPMRVAQQPTLVYSGTNYAIIWSDVRDLNNELYLSVRSPTGTAVGTGESRLTTEPNLQFGVRATWNPDRMETGVVWMDSRDVGMMNATEIYFARLDATGTMLGAPVRVTTRPTNWKDYPSIAWSGSEYLVAWPESDFTAMLPYSVRYARLDGLGTLQGSDVVLREADTGLGWPQVAWSGNNFGISFMDTRNGNPDVYLARVSSDGALIGTPTAVTSHPGNSLFPSLSYGVGQFGLVWVDDRDGGNQIYFSAVRDDGTIAIPERRITCTAFPASLPDVSWTGVDWAVSWSDWRHGNSEVFIKRLAL